MWETILKVGSEGGGLTLKGLKLNDGTWLFTRFRDESTLAEFLPEINLDTLLPFLKSQLKIASGFE